MIECQLQTATATEIQPDQPDILLSQFIEYVPDVIRAIAQLYVIGEEVSELELASAFIQDASMLIEGRPGKLHLTTTWMIIELIAKEIDEASEEADAPITYSNLEALKQDVQRETSELHETLIHDGVDSENPDQLISQLLHMYWWKVRAR